MIHSVNSSHVPTVLVNHEGLCGANRLLVSPWPSLRHPQRLNAMTVRYRHDHTVVILSRDHDFSCKILPVAICSTSSSSFPLTSPDVIHSVDSHRSSHLKVLFAQFMKQIHEWLGVICSGMQQVTTCQV